MARSLQTVTSDLAEHYTRYKDRGAALFATEYGATFRHIGSDTLDLLHRLTTNSLIDLADGSARRTILTNEKGKIVDVFWVLKISDKELLLVTDSTDPSSMQHWINRFTIIEDAEISDFSDFLSRWYVVGPNASAMLGKAFPELDFTTCDIGELRRMDAVKGGVALFLRTDSAVQESWLVIGGSPAASEINARFANLKMFSAPNALFDYIRVKNQAPIAGYDLIEDVNPLEAGLLHLIDFEKGCYIGQEVIARLDTYDKVQRSLVGFSQLSSVNIEKSIEIGDTILSEDGGRRVGWVTSIAHDPKTNELIGLAYLRIAHSECGTVLPTSEGSQIKVAPLVR